MLKKIIKYEDYNGNEREDVRYFNITETELIKMSALYEKPLSEKMEEAVKNKDNKLILNIFEDILLKSYGVKSEDGTRFIKNKELTDEFIQSEAYNKLFVELATNTDELLSFIINVLPKNVSSKLPSIEELKKTNA